MDKNVVAERMRSAKAAGMSEADAVLVSMKRDKSKDKKSDMSVSCGSDSDYPYGLTVTLDNDSLEKLGITSLPEADETVTITAEATISSVSSSMRNGKRDRSLTLQITKMALSDMEPADAENDSDEDDTSTDDGE